MFVVSVISQRVKGRIENLKKLKSMPLTNQVFYTMIGLQKKEQSLDEDSRCQRKRTASREGVSRRQVPGIEDHFRAAWLNTSKPCRYPPLYG